MANPIDPLRMRLFSELNLQLARHGVTKDVMNETSKHLAFLVRYYTNDPQFDPLRVSVPIINIPSDPELDVFGIGDSMGLNISLVVQEVYPPKQATPVSTPAKPPTPTATSAGTRRISLTTGPAGTPTAQKPPVPKQNGTTANGNAAQVKPSTPQGKQPATHTHKKPRMRVLIESTGAPDHYKCLINGFRGTAERVIAGILSEDEEIVAKVEDHGHDGKGRKGQAKDCNCGRGPVWDVKPWNECC